MVVELQMYCDLAGPTTCTLLLWTTLGLAVQRQRWCYIDNTQSANCDCGEPQTMAHLLCCRLLDVPCFPKDLSSLSQSGQGVCPDVLSKWFYLLFPWFSHPVGSLNMTTDLPSPQRPGRLLSRSHATAF